MNPYLHSIYCDDVRHEVNGKLSYIGVYSGKLLVPSVPVIVPKLCVAITAVTPAKESFKKFSIRILKNDEKLIEQEISPDQLKQDAIIDKNLPMSEKSEKIKTLNFLFQFSPFLIESNFVLRVRANTDRGELRAPALIIAQIQTT